MSYRRLLTKNNNQEMHIKVTVNEKEIIVENNLSKEKDKYSIEDVKKIREKKMPFVYWWKKKREYFLLKKDLKQETRKHYILF